MYLKITSILSIIVSINTFLFQIQKIDDLIKILYNNTWVYLKICSNTHFQCQKLTQTSLQLQKQYSQIVFFQFTGSSKSQQLLLSQLKQHPTSLILFNHQFPITYYGHYNKQDIKQWIDYITKFDLPDKNQLHLQPDLIFYGNKNMNQYLFIKTFCLNNVFLVCAFEYSQKQTFIQLNEENITEFMTGLEQKVFKIKARFQDFTQEVQYKIFIKKMDSVIFVNRHSIKQFDSLFQQLAYENYNIVFTQIKPTHPQYLSILQYLSSQLQPSIYALSPVQNKIFKLQQTISSESIINFISKFKNNTLQQYILSQHPNTNNKILTIHNKHLIHSLPKDIVIFFYNSSTASTIINLANQINAYLQQNKNIHIFICDYINSNTIFKQNSRRDSGIVFVKYQNKEEYIQFDKEIRFDDVIDFIKQNTMFDWIELQEYGTSQEEEKEDEQKQQQEKEGNQQKQQQEQEQL